jgi:hypothetical protein
MTRLRLVLHWIAWPWEMSNSCCPGRWFCWRLTFQYLLIAVELTIVAAIYALWRLS